MHNHDMTKDDVHHIGTKKLPDTRYKPLGLISILTAWVGGGYLTARWYEPRFRTISKMVASHGFALIIFAATLIIGGTLFYLFSKYWFAPTFRFNPWYMRLLTIALICQYAVSFIPDVPGVVGRIHAIFAYTFAADLLLLGKAMLWKSNIRPAVKYMGWCLVGLMWLLFFYLLIPGRSNPSVFFDEISFIVIFHVLVLMVIYFGQPGAAHEAV